MQYEILDRILEQTHKKDIHLKTGEIQKGTVNMIVPKLIFWFLVLVL